MIRLSSPSKNTAKPYPLKQCVTGFTLIEVMVSLLILTILGAMGYLSYAVVSKMNEDSINRSMAVNLAQRTLERVRTQAQVDFDNLTTGHMENIFATDPQEQDVNREFFGFARAVTITPAESSTEIKRVEVEVSWNERGAPRTYRTVVLISRPSAPLPGNIHGKVTNAQNGNPVANAAITVVYSLNNTTSFTTRTNGRGEYTFWDPGTHVFRLPAGDWQLTATHVNFDDYSHPTRIGVGSNQDVEVNFSLTPKPEPAHINGRVIDDSTNVIIPQFVSLYQNGNFIRNNGSASGRFDFEIPFQDTDPQCFTLITSNNYENVLNSGDTAVNRTYPYAKKMGDSHCGGGNFPNCQGRSFDYRGWSSAQIIENNIPPVCANPWTGNAASDRICVEPGETRNIDIALHAVPTATLRGTVRDSEGHPFNGDAFFHIYWHNGDNGPITQYLWDQDQEAEHGQYSILVPAEQELFPNNSNFHLKVVVYGMVRGTCCCNRTCDQRVSLYEKIGPIRQGDVIEHDFRLRPASASQCGNANGRVIDARIGNGLTAAIVYLRGAAAPTNTDSGGRYSFVCPPGHTGFSIPRDSYVYVVGCQKSGFYPFASDGSGDSWRWYTRRAGITIQPNTTVTYGNINLLSIGTGVIKGRVVEAGSGNGVSGATVRLDSYWNNYDRTTTTDPQGRFTFSGALESWPALAIRGNPDFVQEPQPYSAQVIETSQYYGTQKNNIILNRGETTDLGNLPVSGKGAL